ncbi:conserved hypothetical protein [Candidatus Zixiibacteriota bacterium]|nr:conserved hypothetical protein [candidate division Zixibacteria bacterium]
MNTTSSKNPKFHIYEYILYWLATAFILLLAIPVLIGKFVVYLVRSTGAPLKSAGNFIGFILVLLIISMTYLTYEVLIPYNIGSEHHTVTVEENEPFSKTAANLHQAGIIRSEHLFRMAAVLGRIDKYTIPGRYDFRGEVSLYDILQKFKRRDVATVMVTIPEGSNIYKIGSILSHDLGIDSAAFVTRANDTAFTKARFNINGLEGYLFPETYQFWYGMKIDNIFDAMYEQFQRRVAPLADSLPPDIPSLHDLITLASIIEGEATVDDEMPVVSSVYHNRLKDNMLLQADPTVLYALGGAAKALSRDDLKIQSPYNTYNVAGLPPGPINCPGMKAILAALRPAQTEYLYFVADGTGHHIFSRTLDEHNNARIKIKRMRRYSRPS